MRSTASAWSASGASRASRNRCGANHVWTYDFIFGATAGGKRLKVLTVLDPVHRGRAGHRAGSLADLGGRRGRPGAALRPPRVIRSNSGPEFIAFELTEWLTYSGAETYHIEPNKPWQNAYGAHKERRRGPRHAQELAMRSRHRAPAQLAGLCDARRVRGGSKTTPGSGISLN
jgi:transposase InsO family protein